MSKAKILVTGGTGYIGSHTVVELQQAGFEVVVIDDLSNSKIEILDGIQQITGIRPDFGQFNLCDAGQLDAFLNKHPDIQTIIHFAASKAVGESVQLPLLYYKNNLNSLMNLLEGMKKYQIPTMVFSSSCTVYGQPDELPVTEKAPFQPAASPYGNTKRICEEIIQDTLKADMSLKAISLRYFNPIGAHDSALIGELPQGIPNNLVPYITQVAFGIRESLSIFGGDYQTSDGTCVRDYIHVVDLAKAHVIATQRLLDGKNVSDYEFFNLGTGKGTSVLEAVHAFEKACGTKLNYKIAPRRPGDIEAIYADTHFANEVLGWKAQRDLDDMMLTAWNWEKNYRESVK
jgi:UDP-glucose 4-epimerase